MKLGSNSLKRLFGEGLSKLNHVPKFYKEASYQELEPSKFYLMLDSKKVKTPDKHTLYLPNECLAEIVATEFNLQQDYIRTSAMPMVRFLIKISSVLQRVQSISRKVNFSKTILSFVS